MRELADISSFMSLQNGSGTKTRSFVSNYNVNIDELKKSIEEWMDAIDVLRSMKADPEAESEEAKLEQFMTKMRDRAETATEATRTSIIELKRNGALREKEIPQSSGGFGEGAPSDTGNDGGLGDLGDFNLGDEAESGEGEGSDDEMSTSGLGDGGGSKKK